ncbi:NUDIX domain-containing protein [Enterovirga aerilata]|uniref:GDP-mannose pyrophosphatase n=1 Tax=Enterovirga aerilata TaxID=2730920 RepID=A0A849HYJ7_9HYPH|nr:NUDIX hydrolase [Enterovirga sp. DB1703]NNM72182.1 NUDIX hydrolase [Enterovirga sp. DB1703]
MPYAIVRTEPKHEGWCSLLLATLRKPDGGEIRRELEDHGAAVAVLPYDPERRVAMMVRQFRTPVLFVSGGQDLLECPAGLLDSDDPVADARREAEEEVGLHLAELEPVSTVWSMPGISTERMHLFLAPYSASDVRGEGGGLATEHEDITKLELPLGELAAMADDGRLDDMKTLLLVQTLRLRRPDLFLG